MPRPSPINPLRVATLVTLLTAGTGQAIAASSGEELLQATNQRISDIDTEALRAQLAARPDTVLIDVRTAGEIHLLGGMIDAARSYNIPRGWLELRIADTVPDKDTPVVVYCGINQRSPLAADTLMQMGYSDVKNYAAGFFAWRDAGLPVEAPDLALDSMLFSRPRQVADGVWSAIGATEPPSYENSGHNNNLSFVIGDDAVLVVNAGDNYLLARALHEEIRAITDRPVKYVVLENGQGHAAMGSAYWKEQGGRIIAHADAQAELESHGEQILERVLRRSRDKGMGTRLVLPDETFSERKVLELGGRTVELLYLGPAHSPGDISVWLPAQRLVIAGDIAFHQRLLPVFEYTDTAAWIETWQTFSDLGAQTVIPGHGVPTTMDVVTRYTKDYLVDVRRQIADLLEQGGGLEDIGRIDQSAYRHLDTFDELARLNASRIFRAMEFE